MASHQFEPLVSVEARPIADPRDVRCRGELRSFGIASMISWRGVWYVVHLGAVLRSNETRVVDEPASGPGTSEYSATC
jgi:hypothetical protein